MPPRNHPVLPEQANVIATAATGNRWRVDRLTGNRFRVVIERADGTIIAHGGAKASVRARCAADADPADRTELDAAIAGA